MAKLIYIKPIVRGSKFWQRNNSDVKGRESFPETRKNFPLCWSHKEHRYVFKDLTDDAVYELAKKSRLTYETGPDKGKQITEFDVYHKECPFFSHSALYAKIYDEILIFNENNPLDKLKLCSFKANNMVADGEKSIKQTAGAKWVIIDKEEQEKEKVLKYSEEMEINKYFVPGPTYLGPEKMRAILKAYNDPTNKITPDTPSEVIAAELYRKANSNTVVRGIEERELFFKLVEMPKDDFELRVFIKDCTDAGILRQSRGVYSFGSEKIASNIETLIAKLKDDNDYTFNQLKDALRAKTRKDV